MTYQLTGAALIVVGLVAVMLVIDSWAIAAVSRLPETLIAVFNEITDFGKSGWFLVPLGVLLVGIAAKPAVLSRMDTLVLHSIFVRAGFLFVAIAAPGLFTTIFKRLVGRARPYAAAGDPYTYIPFAWRSEYASFPSGHAATSFAAAIAIGAIWPRTRMVMWIYAIIIAISRVVVSAHYPSDVIGSAVVGVVGALLVRNYFAARGVAFGIRPDGSVHPFAGPSWWRIKRIAGSLFIRRETRDAP